MGEIAVFECPICLCEYAGADGCRTKCGHQFCLSCFELTLRAGPVPTSGSCPMCREPVSFYSAVALSSGQALREPRHRGIADSVFVQHGGLGASYHFGAGGACAFIDYTSAPAEWVLDDGRRPPDHQPFADTFYDAQTRTFSGVVHWAAPATFFGAARWEYTMVFDEGFGFIAAGERRSYGADGAFIDAKPFPDVLSYYRQTAPPEHICGQVYIQTGELGVASYHFDDCSEESCAPAYISYSSAPERWRLDGGSEGGTDGPRPPSRKPFVDASYDRASRTFRGTVLWPPPGTFAGDARWEYEMMFSEDFTTIVGGQVRAFAPDGGARHTHHFGLQLQYVHYNEAREELRAAVRRRSTEAWLARGEEPGERPPQGMLDLARLMRMLVGAE